MIISHKAYSSQLTIKDPSGLLNSIDTYVGIDFDSSFFIGDKVWYEEKSCRVNQENGEQYTAICEEPIVVDDEVIAKTTEGIRTLKGNIITRVNFQNANGNYLRLYFDKYLSDTTLASVIVNMEKITFENFNANGKTIKGIRVFYKLNLCRKVGSDEECFLLPQEMLLGRNMPMLGQVLELIFHRETTIRTNISVLKDFIRP